MNEQAANPGKRIVGGIAMIVVKLPSDTRRKRHEFGMHNRDGPSGW